MQDLIILGILTLVIIIGVVYTISKEKVAAVVVEALIFQKRN